MSGWVPAGAVPPELVCPVCSEVASDPVRCNSRYDRKACAYMICCACLQRCTKCPQCQGSVSNFVAAPDLQRAVATLAYKCPHVGCTVTAPLDAIGQHVACCPYAPVACPFNNHGCPARIHLGELDAHMAAAQLQHMALLAESLTNTRRENEALQQRVQHLEIVSQGLAYELEQSNKKVAAMAGCNISLFADVLSRTEDPVAIQRNVESVLLEANHHFDGFWRIPLHDVRELGEGLPYVQRGTTTPFGPVTVTIRFGQKDIDENRSPRMNISGGVVTSTGTETVAGCVSLVNARKVRAMMFRLEISVTGPASDVWFAVSQVAPDLLFPICESRWLHAPATSVKATCFRLLGSPSFFLLGVVAKQHQPQQQEASCPPRQNSVDSLVSPAPEVRLFEVQLVDK